MASKVIVDDGTTRVEVPTSATVDLSVDFSFGGNENLLRSLNGTLIKQSRWYKSNILVTAQGRTSPGLESIDWCKPIILDVTTEDCSALKRYYVYCTRPQIRLNHGDQRINWTLDCRMINNQFTLGE